MAVLEANASNFDDLIHRDYTVIDMYGTHCGACVALAPVFEAASIDMPFLTFARCNIHHGKEGSILAARYNIQSIPTLLFFRRGKLILSAEGSMDRKKLDSPLLSCSIHKRLFQALDRDNAAIRRFFTMDTCRYNGSYTKFGTKLASNACGYPYSPKRLLRVIPPSPF